MDLNEKLAARRRELATEAEATTVAEEGALSVGKDGIPLYTPMEIVYIIVSILSGLFLMITVVGMFRLQDEDWNYGRVFMGSGIALGVFIFACRKLSAKVKRRVEHTMSITNDK